GRGHQRGHHVGTCPGQLGSDLDGGKIDLRQRGDRQPQVAEQAAEHNRHSEQRGRDRPVNEGRRYAHGLAGDGNAALGLCLPLPPPRGPRVPSGRGRRSGTICPLSSAPATATRVPSARRAKPVVMTRSPVCRPLATTALASSCCVSVTGRTVTVSPSLST